MNNNCKRIKTVICVILCVLFVVFGFSEMQLTTFAGETECEREVSTDTEFMEALSDPDVDVIKLVKDINIPRSEDSKDNAFVINRSVTICGKQLRLERSGIILGAAVTFKDIELYFASAVRNAIIANGYALTLENVSNGASAYSIDIFCGGITDYNGGNASDIPVAGTHGSVTFKGNNMLTGSNIDTSSQPELAGGKIYAGSLSDLGKDAADVANEYSGDVTIIIENGASGFGYIYAHGARENRDGGYANEWKASADLYKVSGNVQISYNTLSPVTVYGQTGGSENASFVYKGDGSGYLCNPTLINVDKIALVAPESGKKTYLAPTMVGEDACVFRSLSVPADTRLSFENMDAVVSASSLTGGGELIFKTGEQQLQITDIVSGTTKIAIGGIDENGINSSGSVKNEWTYVAYTGIIDDSEYHFEVFPNANACNMVLEHDGDGNWITKLEESAILLKEVDAIADITITEAELKATESDIMIPLQITYHSKEDEMSYLGEIPMYVTINGKDTQRVWGALGYEYVTGDTVDDIAMWVDFDSEGNEVWYIANGAGADYTIPSGKYDIAIKIPARFMEDEQSKTIEFTMKIICSNHTGGEATCTEKAKCDRCEERYGEVDSSNHTGGEATCTEKAKCDRCEERYGEVDSSNHTGGKATCTEKAKCDRCEERYGEVDSSNHTGGTEIRGAKEATVTDKGYTGDIHCGGCGVKLFDGEDIPVLIPDVKFTVVFNANGGNALSFDKKIVSQDQVIGTLPNVKRDGYIFKGWYTALSGGTKVTANMIVNDDITLYARWEKVIISIEQANVTLSYTSCTYSGNAKQPKVTVVLKDKTLKNEKDYIVTYEKNKNAGTATVVITGRGNYKGTIKKAFTIKKASLSKADLKLSATSYIYNGKSKTPTVKVVLNKKTLKKDADYTVTYKDNKYIGKAVVIIKGKGNYTGTIKKTFTIQARKGTTFTVDGLEYKITSTSSKTVAFMGVSSKKIKKVEIPKTVKYGGVSFKVTAVAANALKKNTQITKVTIGGYVTSIGKNAFYGCKNLKVITVKSNRIEKVGSNVFKGIYSKAVIKVPEKKYKVYKKLLKGSGIGSKVKVVSY